MMTRVRRALAGLVALMVVAPASAAADALTVSAESNPAVATRHVDVGSTLDFSGATAAGRALIFATIKPAGGVCAATPGADSGHSPSASSNPAVNATGFPLLIEGPGPFLANARVAAPPGGYLLCFWLVGADGNGNFTQVTAQQAMPFSVNPVSVSLSLRGPRGVVTAHRTQNNLFVHPLTVSYQAYNSETLLVAQLPRGVGHCAATYSQSPPGSVLKLDRLTDPGAHSVSVPISPRQPGTLHFCAWIETAFAPHAADAGPVAIAIPVRR
jgi:hypothetical protein